MDVEQTYKQSKFRGKLYALSEDAAWEDTGTGYVSIGTHEDGSRRLQFRDEETGNLLHDAAVFPSDTYQLQGEGDRQTIIVWEDQDTQKDWALSFQDADGTAEIWEAICKVPESAEPKGGLPIPKWGNLGDIARMLTAVPPSQREAYSIQCMSNKFITGLREVFHTAEDFNSLQDLGFVWQIVKGIFLLSNPKLTQLYLRRDLYHDVLGMLEYDEGLPADKRIAHRQVLRGRVKFNQVLKFEDADLLEKIHLNYRLQYLKDIVLPRLVDDAAFMTLTQMININTGAILSHLQKSETLLQRLVQQIREGDRQSFAFLQDACRLAKTIAPVDRNALYEKLVEQKIFEAITPYIVASPALCASVPEEVPSGVISPPRHMVIEILLLMASHDAAPLRRFLYMEESETSKELFRGLIVTLDKDRDQGVQGQATEVFKFVLDCMPIQDRKEKDAFLDWLYDRGAIDEIMSPVRSTDTSSFAMQMLCDILVYSVLAHGYRSKLYILRHNLAHHAVRLLSGPQRFLHLGPVRLIRAMLTTKDDAYFRYIIKFNYLAPIMKAFQQCLQPPALGGNLFVSATLDVIEHIRLQNAKVLVEHLCTVHTAIIEEFAPRFKALQGLLLRHQQNLEYEAHPPSQYPSGGPVAKAAGGNNGRPIRIRSPGRNEDSDDDEAYFESQDEDEEPVVQQSPPEGAAAPAADAPASSEAAGAPAAGAPAAEAAAVGTHGDQAAGGEGDASMEAPSKAEAPAATQAATPEPAGAGATASLQGLLGGYADDEEEPPAASHAAGAPAPPDAAATEAGSGGGADSAQPAEGAATKEPPSAVAESPDVVAEHAAAAEDKGLGCRAEGSEGHQAEGAPVAGEAAAQVPEESAADAGADGEERAAKRQKTSA